MNMDTSSGALPRQCRCPVCDVSISLVFRLDDPAIKPKVGDLTVCFQCTAVLRVDIGYQLKALSDQHVELLPDYVRSEINRVRQELQMARTLRTN